MIKGDSKESTEIGNGIIDFKEIFSGKKQSGMQCYFVEQESFKLDPVESISISHRYLKSLKNT
jgi:sugar phosphate isomerase/epimerase